MSLDMGQLRKMFYEECRENLETLEQVLLNLDVTNSDSEEINTIFRAAHSIKGGAGTFGLLDISEFTHSVEAYLDLVRNGERQLTPASIDLLLRSVDCIHSLLEAHESGVPNESNLKTDISQELERLLGDEPSVESEPDEPLPEASDAGSLPYHITFGPHPELFFSGNDPLRILRECHELDPNMSICVDTSTLPMIEQLEAELCYLKWHLVMDGQLAQEEISEIFEWVEDECDLIIMRGKPESGERGVEEASLEVAPSESISSASTASKSTESEPITPKPIASEPSATKPSVETPAKTASKPTKTESSVGSIRVDIDKVDSLINLVGELVITQSMLTEIGNDFTPDKLDKLKAGLEQLLQNSKELQDNVLNIRMLPMSFAFSRFPRLVRDLSSRLDKQVELVIKGEHTELDKTVLERIVDPLVHLVRNGIDHGIESRQTRSERGKPEAGIIELNAFHQGGSIIIQICDDGAGLDCDVLWRKAQEKGVVASDANRDEFSKQQVMNLIFAPGFSTAESVSDISGRGVGMDVVKRNIEELGGHIEVESELGKGSRFTISLPLTLAILDGQLIKVADQVFVIPLLTIIESVSLDESKIKRASGGVLLYRLREESIPIMNLQSELELAPAAPSEHPILCFVEAAGNRVGLLVDELLEQQQVVIKSLESNYSKVSGISGATILGDGSVSLILDIQGLITGFLKTHHDAAGSNGLAA